MKKITLIAALISLYANAQTTFSNNVTIQVSSGTGSLQCITTDTNNFSAITAQAGTVQASFASFAENGGVGTLYDNSTAWFSTVANACGIINEQPGSTMSFATGGYGPSSERLRIASNGQVIIEANGSTHPMQPGAFLTIAPGNGIAAPIAIPAGQLLSPAQNCKLEVDANGDLYWTNNSGVRTKLN